MRHARRWDLIGRVVFLWKSLRGLDGAALTTIVIYVYITALISPWFCGSNTLYYMYEYISF